MKKHVSRKKKITYIQDLDLALEEIARKLRPEANSDTTIPDTPGTPGKGIPPTKPVY